MKRFSEQMEWRKHAACWGKPIDDFSPRDQERESDFLKRVNIEEVCPSSCPVRQQCAKEAILMSSVGVIRAGVLLPATENLQSKRYRKLAEIALPIMDSEERKILDVDFHEKLRMRREWFFV